MNKQVLLLSMAVAVVAHAGVSNPDISLIGQVRSDWTNDPNATDQYRPTLGLGEVEMVAQSALNPYADGTFVLAIGEEGLEIEEGYIDLNRALPWGFALKTGKFRAPFGKLNAAHPHAYPFLETPHLLDPESGMIPGEESYDDVALELSELFPGVGSWTPQLSVAVQQGSLFRTGQDTSALEEDYDSQTAETHPSLLIHSSNGFELGENVVGDFGLSYARGTNNVAANTHTNLYGTDLKLKIQLGTETRLVLQGEGVYHQEELASWNSEEDNYSRKSEDRYGFLSFADLTMGRFNIGSFYEQASGRNTNTVIDRSVKGFAGFSLMEETTVFRLAAERRWVAGEGPVNTASLQILYSMGPHKAHQF